MLRNALQSSTSSLSQPNSQISGPESGIQPSSSLHMDRESQSQPSPRSTAQILIGWAPQLRQMRELGITDDIVAIQALEATNGDVQAAINIIFSDFN